MDEAVASVEEADVDCVSDPDDDERVCVVEVESSVCDVDDAALSPAPSVQEINCERSYVARAHQTHE